MSYGVSRFICWLILLCIARNIVLAAVAEWPYNVTPHCTPNVDISVGMIGQDRPFDQLHIKHKLVFDGQRYFSRLYLPIIESRARHSSSGEIIWVDILGDEHCIDKRGNQRWKITEAGDDRLTIEDDVNHWLYVYTRGKLCTFRTPDNIYHISLRGHSIVIERSGSNVVLLEARLDEIGRPIAIMSSRVNVVFSYNTLDALQTVNDKISNQRWSMDYQDGLLIGCCGIRYTWTQRKTLRYLEGEAASAPAVDNDGVAKFNVREINGKTTVEYKFLSGEESGVWIFNRRDETVKLLRRRPKS